MTAAANPETAVDTSTRQVVPDPVTCDGRTGYMPRAGGWGFHPINCDQSVGLTSFRDAAGRTRHHCSRAGHRASAVRRYGAWQEPWTEAESREAWGR